MTATLWGYIDEANLCSMLTVRSLILTPHLFFSAKSFMVSVWSVAWEGL